MNLLQRYTKLRKKNKKTLVVQDSHIEDLEFIIKTITPIKNIDYFDGKDGYTPIKNKDYFDGKDGYTPIKNKDYFDGKDGTDGKDGYTPIKGKDYFDGKNGKDGRDGKDGKNGATKATTITARTIRDKLEDLEGESRLDASAIKNIELYASNKVITTTNGGTTGGGTWGTITGTLSAQTDLQTVLNTKLEASDISGLLRTDGTNHMLAPLGINTDPRAGSIFDAISSDTGSVSNVTSGSLTINYSAGSNYYNEGYSFSYDIYAYRDFDGTRVYSTTAYTVSGSDDSGSTGYYRVDLAWGEVLGADGYRVIVTDNWYGASGNYYFDTENLIASIDGGYIIETASYYASGSTVTPKTSSAGADFYISKVGDVFSTRHFYFENLPTLNLGNTNGLVLVGGTNRVLSLPTTANVNLGGISLKAGRVPTGNHIVFPQGYGGSTSPGIRFEGGQTDGGLAMDDGIMEFWNNFSRYVTPVSGRLQAVFRIDTRSGYESEGFIVGGSSPAGTGAVAIGVDFNYFDVNLCYYGHGSVAIGSDTNTLGVRGTDGYLAVKKSIYVGENLYVNSAGGMKIATTTSQKIGFWNTTPIVQPTTSISVTGVTFTANSGTAINDASTIDGYTLKQVVKALRNIGILA